MNLCSACGRVREEAVCDCPSDGNTLTPFEPAIPAGEVVAGRFRVVRPIGVGPSGQIFEGSEEPGGERVVVKLLSADVSRDKRLSEQVRRHLLRQKDFSHPNVVRLREVDKRGEQLLVVRDWVDGRRLRDILARDGALTHQRALALAYQICEALGEAHRAGLLHLQVRTSNVFVDSGEGGVERACLVDFGIGPRTRVGNKPIFGSPRSISPEQVEGKIVSFRSDIFSAGVLLFEMVSGSPPFTGDDAAVLDKILNSATPVLGSGPAASVLSSIGGLVSQMMQKKPIHRPIGMAQVCEKLRAIAGAAGGPPGAAARSVEEDAAGPRPSPPPGAAAVARIALRRVDVHGENGSPDPAAPGTPARLRRPHVATLQIVNLGSVPSAVGGSGVPAGGASGGAVPPPPPPARQVVSGEVPGETSPVAPVSSQSYEDFSSAGAAPPVAPPHEPPIVISGGEHPSAPAEASEAGPSPGQALRPGHDLPALTTKVAGPRAYAATLAAPPAEAARPVPPDPVLPPESSSTMSIEPDILEESDLPPPLEEAGAERPSTLEEAASAPYRRGLTHGLAAGIAFTVICVLVTAIVVRRDAPAAGVERPPPRGAVPSDGQPGDAGSKLVAEGPMQVSAVAEDVGGDAVSGPATEASSGQGEPADGGPEVPGLPVEPQADAGVEPPPEVAEAGTAEAAPVGPAGRRDAVGVVVPPPPRDAAVREPDATGPRPPVDAGVAPPAEAGSASGSNADRAAALVDTGNARLDARDFSGARTAFEEAVRLDPRNRRAAIGLGKVAFQQQDFADAVRYLEPAYASQGNLDLGIAYVRVGRLDDAERQFELVLGRNPNNADAQRALEAVRRQMGQ